MVATVATVDMGFEAAAAVSREVVPAVALAVAWVALVALVVV